MDYKEYDYLLVFAPKENAKINFNPSLEEFQKNPDNNFFPLTIVNDILMNKRLPNSNSNLLLAERLDIFKDSEECEDSSFPLRGSYSIFDRGSRTEIAPGELVPGWKSGEVQYRHIESPLTSDEYQAISSALQERSVY